MLCGISEKRFIICPQQKKKKIVQNVVCLFQMLFSHFYFSVSLYELIMNGGAFQAESAPWNLAFGPRKMI